MTGLLARDVTEEREQLERRNSFVSIASRELRTSMTAIMGFSELLLNLESSDSPKRAWMERIYKNSQMLSAIVEDMLNVSRIQSGKLALNLERLDLAGAVDDVLVGLRPQSEGHVLVAEIAEDTPRVVADREKLNQVLANLVTNAVKYSPDGGPVTVFATYTKHIGRVVVGVRSSGIGIAPEDQKQMFTSFYRIRRPETEEIRGTGLGLNIVRGLVAMMKGEVWVESELNKGSTFYFSMPTESVDSLDGT